MKHAVERLVAIERRIRIACLTVSSWQATKPRGFFSTWPAYALEHFDAEIEGSQRSDEAITRGLVRAAKFFPTAKQIDDALPALELLNGLDKRTLRIVRLRALQSWYGTHIEADDDEFAHWRGGWRGIGRLAGCSHTLAQRKYERAMTYALERDLERLAKAA